MSGASASTSRDALVGKVGVQRDAVRAADRNDLAHENIQREGCVACGLARIGPMRERIADVTLDMRDDERRTSARAPAMMSGTGSRP